MAYQSITVDSEPEKKQNALKIAFQRVRKDLEFAQKISMEGAYIWKIQSQFYHDS
ncbi:MAG: hypothetical protein PHQ03_04910 [Methylococcales bacterium]|nr:hypothetical protein [Methylococcales bacterium]